MTETVCTRFFFLPVWAQIRRTTLTGVFIGNRVNCRWESIYLFNKTPRSAAFPASIASIDFSSPHKRYIAGPLPPRNLD